MEVKAFSIPEFCRRWKVGRTFTYKEIGAGRLRLTKIGKLSRITPEAEDDWQRLLEEESAQATAEWRRRIKDQTERNKARVPAETKATE